MIRSTIHTDNFDPDSINYYDNRRADRDNLTDIDDPTDNRTREKKRRTDPKRTKKAKKEPAIKRFLTDKRLKIFLGIILLLVGVYLLISSISFLSSGADDQSRVLNNTIEQMALSTTPVNNAGGPLGAFLSQQIVTEAIGIGAFVLIFYVIALGLSLVGLRHYRFWALTFKSLILTVTLSTVIGLVTFQLSGPMYWGGYYGYYINDYLLSHTGVWGALAVSIALTSLVILIFFNELSRAYIASRRKVKAQRERIRRLKEAKEEEQRIVEQSMRETAIDAEKQPEESEQATTATNDSHENVDFDPADLTDIDDSTDSDTLIDTVMTTDDTSRHHQQPLVVSSEESASKAIVIRDTIRVNDADEPAEPTMVVNTTVIEEASEIASDTYDPTAELSRYRFPSIDLLNEVAVKETSVDLQEQEENKERITKTLADYEIPISHIEATVGPTVTLYEIIPAEGVRIAKIKRLEDDIALSLAAKGIRIIAPIPGKGTIGIEVPNKDPQTVSIRSVIGSRKFQECKMDLPMAMGATISNEVFIADLAKMPHLLVAGATGQGKSVGLNTIIASLLYKKHPAELKFVLVDPKMVEFSLYRKLERHYLAKLPDEEDAIITEPSKVVATLNSLCIEMDNRYSLLRDADVRSTKEYNAKFVSRRLNPEKGHRYLPYIVVIVDEFADLIMTAGKEIETPIARIAQKARAVGMHMIIATQRPSTNVITGVIKANFPGRIAFRVSQMVDSKTILDRTGANQLIGRGDMLFSNNGEMERVQCAFIDTPEVVAICDCIDEQIGYDHAYLLPDYVPDSDGGGSMSNVADRDPLFEEAARFIISSNTASTSSLQRRYSIGYNRAGKIMDQMEAAGIVGPAQGGKPRQVLLDSLQLERLLETF
ncbi:MAG: DNA translocase FtsK [Pseudoflavonifractor sp.]|nr:DNA translocase FtsK [Pseudoflavonifractor sp.]